MTRFTIIAFVLGGAGLTTGAVGLMGWLRLRSIIRADHFRAELVRLRTGRLPDGPVTEAEALARRHYYMRGVPVIALGIAAADAWRAVRHAPRRAQAAAGVVSVTAAGVVAVSSLILASGPAPMRRRAFFPAPAPTSCCTAITTGAAPTLVATAPSSTASRDTTGSLPSMSRRPPRHALDIMDAPPHIGATPEQPATVTTTAAAPPTTVTASSTVATRSCLLELDAVGIDVCV